MDRRSLLAGVGSVLSLSVAGCADSLTENSTEIADVDFETDVDVDKEVGADPNVDFEGDEIHVTGQYSIGNACYDEHLEDPSYDPEDDELQIRLTRQHDGSDECDDLEQLVSYRVIVQIEGTLPETVTVTENMGGETTE